MSEPRLTIGIPTHGRASRCQIAITSALAQKQPARILVSDDSEDDEIEELCASYDENPLVSYVRSPAKTLWGNWRFAAQEAVRRGAEFFSWLQDDDYLAPYFSRRVVRSFNRFPKCLTYCSSLKNSYNNLLAVGWSGNQGPRLALDHIHGNVMPFNGHLLPIMGYFDAWGMAPAKAFRVGPVFESMLESLPDHCDLLTEVLDVAYMGVHANAIADPIVAGLWIFHDSNESVMRNKQKKSKEEVPIAWGFLDTLMDQLPNWRNVLNEWIAFIGTNDLLELYLKTLEERPGLSPYADQIAEMFQEVISLRKARFEELAAVG